MSISSQLPLARIQHLLEHLFNPFGAASSEAKPGIHPLFQPWHTKIPRFLILVATLGDCCLETLDSRPDIINLTRVHIVVWSLKPPPYLDPHT
jgi:hypothetical protein